MKRNAPHMTFRRWTPVASLAIGGLFCTSLFLAALGADSLPQVRLNADSIGPRPVEQLTSRNVPRDYALAWRDLATALSQNDAEVLGNYFTGFANDRLRQRISDQKSTGVRVRYSDHGHEVKALFYSPDGREMQLLDRATLDIKVFDGNKLIHQESVKQTYLVLMTPGADRWFVRALDPISDSQL